MFARFHERRGSSTLLEPAGGGAQSSAAGGARQDSPDSTAALGLGRVGVFWAPYAVPGPTEPFFGSGKYVAAAAWTFALARYGSARHIDVFAPISGLEQCRQHFRAMPPRVDGADAPAASFLPESDAAAGFQTHRYDVMHRPTGIDFTRASYLRSRFAPRIFPATCSQHGISYSVDLFSAFIKLLATPTYPCDAIVCLTESSRRAMAKRLEDIGERYCGAWGQPPPPLPRLELIPWGVDTERFSPRNQAVARQDLGLPPGRPILLCSGRVRIQDKMDWTPLLLAFDRARRLTKARPLLVLSGAVSSGYGDEILAYAVQLGLRDDVQTLFNLPSACLPSLYSASDVFVSPTDSPSESFGLTIVEAMACARPVVASDWNGYKELIVHGQTGFKVRTDWADCLGELNEAAPLLDMDQEHLHVGQSVNVDLGQLAGYLATLIDNSDLREEMGRQARARVEELYDWPVVIAQWEAMWVELMAIARSTERQKEDHLAYLQPNYFEHFAHYASRIIDDATPVQITDRGKRWLRGEAPLLMHPWAQGFLSPACLRPALSALKSVGCLGVGLPVRKLVEILERVHGLRRDRALMHVMWLAKYDLISLGVGPSETERLLEGATGAGGR